MVKLSIIIPVYNVEEYITDCLNSLLDSSRKFSDKDIEIIIVNDGSTDSSLKICNKFLKIDTRFKLINQKNEGLSSARNTGIKHARGQFISFIDSDDIVSLNYVTTILSAINNNKFDILFFKYQRFADNTAIANRLISSGKSKFTKLSKYDAINGLTNDNIGSFAWNKVFNTQLFQNIRFPKGRYFEDIFTTYKLVDAASFFLQSNENLYYYRQREGSILHQEQIIEKRLRILYDSIEARYRLFLYLKKKGSFTSQQENNYYLFNDCIHLINTVYKNNCENRYLSCLSFLKEYNFSIRRDGLKHIIILKLYMYAPKLYRLLIKKRR